MGCKAAALAYHLVVSCPGLLHLFIIKHTILVCIPVVTDTSMSPSGAHLTCAEAATVTAAPGEPPGAEAVVVVPLVLLHVALPVELRSRVSPVAVEHDPDAVELEARLLPHHRHAERPRNSYYQLYYLQLYIVYIPGHCSSVGITLWVCILVLYV